MPDCDAVMVQVPAVNSVALLPDTPQTAGVELANDTLSDELALATRATGLAAKAWPAGPAKLMVWFCLTTVRVKFCVASGAVAFVALIVSGQLPAKDGSHSLYCAVIVKQVDERTRSKTSVNELLRGLAD